MPYPGLTRAHQPVSLTGDSLRFLRRPVGYGCLLGAVPGKVAQKAGMEDDCQGALAFRPSVQMASSHLEGGNEAGGKLSHVCRGRMCRSIWFLVLDTCCDPVVD